MSDEVVDDTQLMGRIQVLTTKKESINDDPFAQPYKGVLVGDIEKVMQNSTGSAHSNQYVDESMSLYGVLDCAEPPYNFDYLAKLYDANSFHAAAVDAKIDNIVGLGYSWEFTRTAEKIREKAEKTSEAKKRRTDVQLDDMKEQLDRLFSGFNSTDELDEILIKVIKDRLTMGNGYLEVGRDAEGAVSYIGHVSARNVRIRRQRDGFFQSVNNKNIFFRNFGDTETPDPIGETENPNELIHIKFYSPVDDYYGIPEIMSAIQAITGIEFAHRYNIDYFENKAVPRYIIKTKGINLNATQQSDLLKFFETTIKGVSHRTVLVPLPGGADKDIDFQPVETYGQEASFIEYIKINIQIILSRHRVPQARIGLSTAATAASESRDSEKTFKEAVCRPEQRILEKKFNAIVKEFTDLFSFKLTEYTLTDEDQQSQIYERYLRWGVIVPDEVRTELGRGPRADGKGDEPVDVRSITEMTGENDLAQAKADTKANNYETRTRDQNRNASKPDSAGHHSGRRSAGQGANPNTK